MVSRFLGGGVDPKIKDSYPNSFFSIFGFIFQSARFEPNLLRSFEPVMCQVDSAHHWCLRPGKRKSLEGDSLCERVLSMIRFGMANARFVYFYHHHNLFFVIIILCSHHHEKCIKQIYGLYVYPDNVCFHSI